MKFKEIINRTSGFSIPIFGIQWNPPELEISKARRIITFFEDRRVLYAPDSMEVAEHCFQSVLEIRKFLTAELGSLDSETELAKNLRAMRAACRKFLNETSDTDNRKIIIFAKDRGHWAGWKFYGDLGIMRSTFGLHIALIASSYGLDIEDELASILPSLDEHDDRGFTKLNID